MGVWKRSGDIYLFIVHQSGVSFRPVSTLLLLQCFEMWITRKPLGSHLSLVLSSQCVSFHQQLSWFDFHGQSIIAPWFRAGFTLDRSAASSFLSTMEVEPFSLVATALRWKTRQGLCMLLSVRVSRLGRLITRVVPDEWRLLFQCSTFVPFWCFVSDWDRLFGSIANIVFTVFTVFLSLRKGRNGTLGFTSHDECLCRNWLGLIMPLVARVYERLDERGLTWFLKRWSSELVCSAIPLAPSNEVDWMGLAPLETCSHIFGKVAKNSSGLEVVRSLAQISLFSYATQIKESLPDCTFLLAVDQMHLIQDRGAKLFGSGGFLRSVIHLASSLEKALTPYVDENDLYANSAVFLLFLTFTFLQVFVGALTISLRYVVQSTFLYRKGSAETSVSFDRI